MKITYLSHSGFLMEWERAYFLFDYDKGKLPEFLPDKQLFIFVSHKHADHYNRDIWKLRHGHPSVTYIVSKDVPLSIGQWEKLGLTEEDKKRIFRVKANEIYSIESTRGECIKVNTLRSTDEGVAFLIDYEGKRIFHAGDLNLWTWSGESKRYNDAMTAAFMLEMNKLKGDIIDIAFFPIDGRQGEETGKGFTIFMETANVKVVFPMHLWGDYQVLTRYREKGKGKSTYDKIMVIEKEGQEFEEI